MQWRTLPYALSAYTLVIQAIIPIAWTERIVRSMERILMDALDQRIMLWLISGISMPFAVFALFLDFIIRDKNIRKDVD